MLGQPEDGDGEGRGPSGGADSLPPCNIWNLCGLCGKFGRPVTEPMWLLYLNRPCGNVLGLETVFVRVCERERERESMCVSRITEELQSGAADLDEKGVIVWIHFQQSGKHSEESRTHTHT